MKQIFTELRKAVLYQHKSLTKAVYTCNADKFILQINRLNTRTILSHISILENRFIFKKPKSATSDIEILQDILTKPGGI